MGLPHLTAPSFVWETPHSMASSEAQLLIVGPDGSESVFAFDALVDESDGMPPLRRQRLPPLCDMGRAV